MSISLGVVLEIERWLITAIVASWTPVLGAIGTVLAEALSVLSVRVSNIDWYFFVRGAQTRTPCSFICFD